MKAYVFPGQGSQFSGMGKDLYEKFDVAKDLFNKANEILGFDITKIMFEGTDEELKQTKVTQPAVFLHSVILSKCMGESFAPDMVAGHSLGELSALTSVNAIDFESGLKIVAQRAMAMQRACEMQPSTMAAILGLEDSKVEELCSQCNTGIVVPANYNCPGQLVVSGSIEGVDALCKMAEEAGCKRAIKLAVSGAFHSPLMKPAEDDLARAISATDFHAPICPVYQNVSTKAEKDPETIKSNLLRQLTSPVKWTQSVENMIADGAESFTEVGPGAVLQGMIKKINKEFAKTHTVEGAAI